MSDFCGTLDDENVEASNAFHEVSLPVNLSLDALLKDLKHNSYYLVNTSIIIAYSKNKIPSLNQYIDHLSLSGCRFFVTRRIAA